MPAAASADGGTDLEFVHDRFFDQAARDSHEGGWRPTFDKLEQYLLAA